MHAQFFWVKNARLSLEKLWILHIRGCVGIPQFFSKNTVSEANGPQQRCLVPKTEGNNQLQCNCKRGIPAINKSSQSGSIRITHRSQHCTTPVLNKLILLSTPLSLPMKLSPSLPFSILEEYEREASKLRNEHRQEIKMTNLCSPPPQLYPVRPSLDERVEKICLEIKFKVVTIVQERT